MSFINTMKRPAFTKKREANTGSFQHIAHAHEKQKQKLIDKVCADYQPKIAEVDQFITQAREKISEDRSRIYRLKSFKKEDREYRFLFGMCGIVTLPLLAIVIVAHTWFMLSYVILGMACCVLSV